MKQVVQHAWDARVTVEDVPAPLLPSGFVLVRTAASLVSAGTERAIAQQKGMAQKALTRPDVARLVVERVAREGVANVVESVRERMTARVPLGYSAAGFVLDADAGGEFKSGDRVACGGAGFANHAEVICVPRQLCVMLPDAVSFEAGAFATVGSIALHGVRLAGVQIGGTVAVIGLGLLGQLAAQMVQAAGCRVLGIDIAADRLELARRIGADAAVMPAEAPSAALALTSGMGVDAVLIAADTPGDEPVQLAGEIARDRGTVVAVGAVGMNLPRPPYFGKELRFVVSRSYGPGRYDPSYEIDGHDYPIGYVRWTERRNMSAVVDLVARGALKTDPIVTHRFNIADAEAAYDLITGKSGERPLAVLMTYPDATEAVRTCAGPTSAGRVAASGKARGVRLGMLGAGNFARSVLLPALRAVDGTRFIGVASAQGLTAKACAERFRFAYCTTDEQRITGDPDIDAVVIATRHHLHARQAIAAASAGKHVFVEKPLCIRDAELKELAACFASPGAPLLMVGFNRRFAPMGIQIKEFFAGAGHPLMVHYRVNAGFIPATDWVHDPERGGGRVIGEVCHFIDFVSWLIGGSPRTVSAVALPDGGRYREDNVVITLDYADGSVATIAYTAMGNRALPKERIEVHGGGRSGVLDDFRALTLCAGGRRRMYRQRLGQDKGHRAECAAFIDAVRTGSSSPIAVNDLIQTTRATFLALESARTRTPLRLD